MGEAEVCGDPGAKRGGHEVKFGCRRAGNAGEEVIGAFDEMNLARLRGGDEIGLERSAGAELVMISREEEFEYRTAGGQEVVADHGRQRAREGRGRPDRGRGRLRSRRAGRRWIRRRSARDGQVEARGEPVERRAEVIDFAATLVVSAFANPGAAEVEAQRRKAEVREGLGRRGRPLCCAWSRRPADADARRGRHRARLGVPVLRSASRRPAGPRRSSMVWTWERNSVTEMSVRGERIFPGGETRR